MRCRATPIPPTTPQVRTQGTPQPPKTHCSRALQCQNTAAHPGESRGWGSVFRGASCGAGLGIRGVFGVAHRISSTTALRSSLLVPAEEMRTANSHALMPHPQGVFLGLLKRKPAHRWAPPASDQVTLTQYSRQRRSSLLPLAPAPKRPCPTPQYSHCSRGVRLSPPPHRRGRSLGHWSLRKPPRSDPGLRRDVPISSSSASVHRASLTHRALFCFQPPP